MLILADLSKTAYVWSCCLVTFFDQELPAFNLVFGPRYPEYWHRR